MKAEAGPALVAGRGLVKRFPGGHLPAVAEASFEAPAGAITALLGPSGSGKTTVLRMLAGLEVPDAGSIRFGDEDVTRLPVRRRGVGFVFQGYALFSTMTVRENIAFGLRVAKAPRAAIEARVDELLRLIQLPDLGHRYPRELSGGQQQRVAFARALAPNPRVLLLDEPFGALDTQVRVELREWLRRLHERTHLTTILVTHDQEEALEVAGHVVVMRAGRVEQAGSPHDLYDHPASAFVAQFVGGANVLRGEVKDGRAAIGSLSWTAPDGARDGERVEAYVRPHDVKIARASKSGSVGAGQVTRLVRVGGYVKVELRLPSGDPMTVQMPKAEIDALGIAAGDRVLIDFLAARVFVEDYAI